MFQLTIFLLKIITTFEMYHSWTRPHPKEDERVVYVVKEICEGASWEIRVTLPEYGDHEASIASSQISRKMMKRIKTIMKPGKMSVGWVSSLEVGRDDQMVIGISLLGIVPEEKDDLLKAFSERRHEAGFARDISVRLGMTHQEAMEKFIHPLRDDHPSLTSFFGTIRDPIEVWTFVGSNEGIREFDSDHKDMIRTSFTKYFPKPPKDLRIPFTFSTEAPDGLSVLKDFETKFKETFPSAKILVTTAPSYEVVITKVPFFEAEEMQVHVKERLEELGGTL